ncbi:MAG: hypothetical protein IIX67_04160 [Clostridia bacterium]|nr:hypothetical protein [Clostridia bacterium]
MRREIDIYDPIEDKIPQKKELNPIIKKIIIYLLCAVIGVGVAIAVIFIADLAVTGGSTPAEAIKEYEKAALLYDVDGMIEYSSEYNKVVLYDNRETSDRLLEDYLTKAYVGRTPKYSESEISFQLISSLEYEKGSRKYEESLRKYNEKIENGSDGIDSVAIVKMKVITGSNVLTKDYLAVNVNGRWFYAYAGVKL